MFKKVLRPLVQRMSEKLYEAYPFLLQLEPQPPVQDPENPWVSPYDFEGCYTATHPGVKAAREDVAAALIIFRGNSLIASKVLRRSRTALDAYISRDKELVKLRSEQNESFLDEVQYQHQQAALKGDLVTQRFFLTTLGKNRGFSSRVDHSSEDGTMTPTTVERRIVDPSKEEEKSEDAS